MWMMSQTRGEFAPEFKREAVALPESSGRPLTQVASELGIQPSKLRAWRTMMQGGLARPRPASAVGRGGDALWPIPSGPRVAKRKLKGELHRTRMDQRIPSAIG
jgi:transposase